MHTFNRGFFPIFLVVLILFISSCSSDNKSNTPTCSNSQDCAVKTCQVASCKDKACTYLPKGSCCGNGKKEDIEDGGPGNECTCPADFGKCEGKAKIPSGTKEVDAKYVEKFCTDDKKCVVGVDPKAIKPDALITEFTSPLFTAEVKTSFNQPLRIPTDPLTFRIRLKDVKDTFHSVAFNYISLQEKGVLYGEKSLTADLAEVGDSSTFTLPISYSLKQLEEVKRFTYKLEYTYITKPALKIGESQDVLESSLVTDFTSSKFTAELTSTFNKPFQASTDKISFRVRLKDADKTLLYPVRLLHLSVTESGALYGEVSLEEVLTTLDEEVTFKVPITYIPTLPQEEKRFGYKLEYEYDYLDSKGAVITDRSSYSGTFSTPVILVKDTSEQQSVPLKSTRSTYSGTISTPITLVMDNS